MVEGLAGRGHHVTVLTTRHPEGLEHEEAPGREVHYLSHAPSRRLSLEYWKASSQAFEVFHDRRPVEIVMDIALSGFGWVTASRKEWPLPYVAFLTGGWKDLLRNKWTEADGPMDLAHLLLRGLPEWWLKYRRWYGTVIGAADRIMVDHASLISILESEFGAPRSKFVAAFSPVDVERFRPDQLLRAQVRKEHGLGEEQMVILMAAVLSKQKGIQIGLEAVTRLCERYPELAVLVVGGGPYRPVLESMTRSLGIAEKVVFCGPVEPEAMPAYFNAGDMFVNPTLRLEGMPIVLPEAMASGATVISSRIGGIPDLVHHGETGLLVTPGDVEALCREIARLLDEPTERKALADAALSYVRGQLTVEHFLELVEATLMDASNRGGLET
jgi:glycosyltransferase involved in cell wall biosynthesis